MTDLVINNNSSHSEWDVIQRQCRAFIASGFLPEHITRGVPPDIAMARAVTIAWKGKELGVPPLQAFSSITVIGGKPCLSAELMLALIYQRVKGAKITFKTPPENQSHECVVEMQRPGGDPQLFRFNMEDAKAAQLIKPNGAWTKYPAAMLRARAVSAGARAVFPDCIMGCYTPEELGGEVIDLDGYEESPAPTKTQEVAKPTPTTPPAAQEIVDHIVNRPLDIGEMICKEWKFKGLKLKSIPDKELQGFVDWIAKEPKPSPGFKEQAILANQYLQSKKPKLEEDEKFQFEKEVK